MPWLAASLPLLLHLSPPLPPPFLSPVFSPRMCTSPSPSLPPPPAPRSGRYKNPSVRPSWYRARQRALTKAQKRAEARLWPAYGLEWRHDKQIDLASSFGRDGRKVLEIGCGRGEAIVPLAGERGECDFVGIDWFRGGLASSLQRIEQAGLTNVRLVRGDAATFLETALPVGPIFDQARAHHIVSRDTSCPLPSHHIPTSLFPCPPYPSPPLTCGCCPLLHLPLCICCPPLTPPPPALLFPALSPPPVHPP